MAPPFVCPMHAMHLVGGQDSHFMTFYQGECTHCHKLDQKSGAWSLPSGPEKWRGSVGRTLGMTG
jgi:hypothetical protein